MNDLPPVAQPAPATNRKPGWPDRAWSLPVVVAVALLSLILGGLGGAALASSSDDARDKRFGPGHSRVHEDGHLRPPGMMNKRQRERWKEWRREQRREMRPSGLSSLTRPTPSR